MSINKMNEGVTTLVFSYNRPMQLDLLLRTEETYCSEKNYKNKIVIYKAGDERYERAYQLLSTKYPDVCFLKENNFKLDVNNSIGNSKYVLFLVDDCVFTRKYSIKEICTFLDICEGTLGFSLRLGKNTKYCYPLYIENDMPPMQKINDNIYAFNWKDAGRGDFSYPLELSSSFYRTLDIKTVLEERNYLNPNHLEWLLSNYTSAFGNNMSFLLCYEISCAFCNPINRVQAVNNNRVGTNTKYSAENLLVLYEKGYRINPLKFDKFVSNGAHQEVELDFVLSEELE